MKVANFVFIAGGTLLSISIGLMAATALLASVADEESSPSLKAFLALEQSERLNASIYEIRIDGMKIEASAIGSPNQSLVLVYQLEADIEDALRLAEEVGLSELISQLAEFENALHRLTNDTPADAHPALFDLVASTDPMLQTIRTHSLQVRRQYQADRMTIAARDQLIEWVDMVSHITATAGAIALLAVRIREVGYPI